MKQVPGLFLELHLQKISMVNTMITLHTVKTQCFTLEVTKLWPVRL